MLTHTHIVNAILFTNAFKIKTIVRSSLTHMPKNYVIIYAFQFFVSPIMDLVHYAPRPFCPKCVKISTVTNKIYCVILFKLMIFFQISLLNRVCLEFENYPKSHSMDMLPDCACVKYGCIFIKMESDLPSFLPMYSQFMSIQSLDTKRKLCTSHKI